jgi:uncharacterized protein YbbC (DUF1343 family)
MRIKAVRADLHCQQEAKVLFGFCISSARERHQLCGVANRFHMLSRNYPARYLARSLYALFLLVLPWQAPCGASQERVLAGVDVLVAQDFAPLQGRSVGLVTNQTGITRSGKSTIETLAATDKLKLVALFAPEHGISGKVVAGRTVRNGHESKYQLPVYSLYGSLRKPSLAALSRIDTLVFDLQDIGSRSYTYISTMGQCMAVCAARNISFVVLDRPNLVGGRAIEGNLPQAQFRSFIGAYPIAYRHGLTVGELARMINGEGWLPNHVRCKLTVIPLRNYNRDTAAHETGLPWRATSPNIPHRHTPFFYAATGILGELSAFSIGIGTKWPFEIVGAPGISGARLAIELNRRHLPGVAFHPASWKSRRGAYANLKCNGVRIDITDQRTVQLTRLNFEIIDAARHAAPRLKIFGRSRTTDRMFDLACGTNSVRRLITAGKSAAQVWNTWNASAVTFDAQRQKYFLYD